MTAYSNQAALVGRILLALMFVTSGFDKLTGFDGTAGYIASKGLPMAPLVAGLTILLEIGAGLAIVFGLYTRWAALALALFTVLAAVLFHNFWDVPEARKMMEQISFMKNLSVAGGMLVLFAFGPGALSLDARQAGVLRPA